ncbi:hypothetical protein MHB46_21460 [Paenibacillus sp. FSL H7-0703]|uniref:hypothetical protein n=1 Tax=Paenibacillus sp. FSL H7-0703 TaxID=2921438 RepID=UPI0030F559E0
MNKSVIFDVSKHFIGGLMDGIKKRNNDSLLVLVPLAGKITTLAPARQGKYKDHFRIKCELLIPKEAIKGADALGDFGAFTVMRLPKSRVQDDFIHDNPELLQPQGGNKE